MRQSAQAVSTQVLLDNLHSPHAPSSPHHCSLPTHTHTVNNTAHTNRAHHITGHNLPCDHPFVHQTFSIIIRAASSLPAVADERALWGSGSLGSALRGTLGRLWSCVLGPEPQSCLCLGSLPQGLIHTS